MRRLLTSRWSVHGSLVAVGVAVVVLLPGVAQAGTGPAVPTPPDPLAGLPGAIGGVLPGAGAGGTGGAGSAGSGTTDGPAAASGAAADSSSPLPAPPSQLDPSQLQTMLAALGISPECSAAVQKDLQAAIQDLPATVQDVVDAIVAQLGSGPPPVSATDPQSGATVLLQSLGSGSPPTFSSPDPAELPTVKDLQQLAADMQKLCVPTTSSAPPPVSGGSHLPPAPQQPVAASQPAAAAPASAHPPVTYPGYAPTGAAPVEPGGAPLAGLAGIVLLSATGATAYRMAFRAGPRP